MIVEDHYDGMWAGPLVDQMASLLIKFAELADDELQKNNGIG